MNTLAFKSHSRWAFGGFTSIAARLFARVGLALRRFAALYAAGRMHQAAIEIRRFEECHRPLSQRDGGPRSRL
jgi:hypothetical protein